jgi:hypothetical protein
MDDDFVVGIPFCGLIWQSILIERLEKLRIVKEIVESLDRYFTLLENETVSRRREIDTILHLPG